MKRDLRAWLAAAAWLGVAACSRGARCGTCGMKIDPASGWISYVTVARQEVPFDTPRCAVTAWRHSHDATSGRFREYYSQEVRGTDGLLFVEGSDVVGPMGPEIVPVAAENARRFARDHNGAPPKTIQQVLEGSAP